MSATPQTPHDPTADVLGDAAPTTFTDAFHADAARLVRRYPVARSALLPLLHLVQSEHGYVSQAGVAECARLLDLTKAEVGAVATFYTMYKREPVGDWLLSVCTNPTCQVAGSQVIFDRYKEALGGSVRDPETKVSIEQAECLGICDAAPVVQVNYDMYGPLTDEEADRLLAGCRDGSPPVSSWSGEPAPTFAQVERELSGADDAFGDALVDAARHSVTGYAVPPAYKSGETDIPVTHPGGDRAGHGGEVFQAAFDGPATNGDRAIGDRPAGDPATAEAADDQSLTPDQEGDVEEVAAAADDTADDHASGADDTGEPEDLADEASEAAAGTEDGDATDDAGADPEMSTDQPAGHASPGTGDDDTSPDEVDTMAEQDDDAGHGAPDVDRDESDSNDAGGA